MNIVIAGFFFALLIFAWACEDWEAAKKDWEEYKKEKEKK